MSKRFLMDGIMYARCPQCDMFCRETDKRFAKINGTLASTHNVCDGCRYANYCNTTKKVFTSKRDDTIPVLSFSQWVNERR